jgi:hypothetical protein
VAAGAVVPTPGGGASAAVDAGGGQAQAAAGEASGLGGGSAGAAPVEAVGGAAVAAARLLSPSGSKTLLPALQVGMPQRKVRMCVSMPACCCVLSS